MNPVRLPAPASCHASPVHSGYKVETLNNKHIILFDLFTEPSQHNSPGIFIPKKRKKTTPAAELLSSWLPSLSKAQVFIAGLLA